MRRGIYYFVIFIFVLCISSCGRREPAPVKNGEYSKYQRVPHKSRRSQARGSYIIVKKGDTLYSIGFNQNIDYKILAKINNIAKPYRIYPGQKIRLKKDKHTASHRVAKSNTAKIKKPPTQTTKIAKNVNKVSTKKPVTTNKKPPHKNTVAENKKPVKPPSNQPVSAAHSRWIWPVNGKLISSFSSSDMSRKGIDIASNLGTPVYASNNGSVVYSGDGLRGYGELIIIKHSNNLLSAYAHNSNRLVKEGQTVKQGQVIAKSGKGTDGRPLLHFEIRKNGQPVNPLTYLPKK